MAFSGSEIITLLISALKNADHTTHALNKINESVKKNTAIAVPLRQINKSNR
jgi:hypothetical protein